MKKFMDTVVADSLDLWEAAANTPFISEMRNNVLDKQKFLNYIVQDSLYLRDYLKSFAMAIYKSSSLKEMQIFYSALGFVSDSENATRLQYLKDNNMNDSDVEHMPMEPECVAYTGFLLGTAAHEDIPEILMAVMPCMLGYYYVFDSIIKRNSSCVNTYFAPLILDYSSEFYKDCCRTWTDYCNEVCENLDNNRKNKLNNIFRQASQHELYFWQMAGRN